MTRILYLPVHRPSLETVRQNLREAEALQTLTGDEVVYAVIEHWDAPFVSLHAGVLEELAAACAVRVEHVTRPRWELLLTRLVERVRLAEPVAARLCRLLHPTSVAYGAGPNKAALLAFAVSAEILHRRDSDHLVARQPDGAPRYPSVLEASAIGRRADTVTTRSWPKPEMGELPVLLVASSMSGDPAHDRRDLFETRPDLVAELHELTGAPREPAAQLAAVTRYFRDEWDIDYAEDFVEPDLTGRGEVGVSCVRTLFEWLPEMPIADTLGCDYLQKNLTYQMELPIAFHSRKMIHRYDVTRTEPGLDTAIDYALRDARYVLLRHVWVRANDLLRANRTSVLDGLRAADSSDYIAAFETARRADESYLHDVARRYSDIHARGARLAAGDRAARLRAIATASADHAARLVEDVLSGVDDFVFLTALWPRLRAAASGGGWWR
jgi:Family of unknown function (DUF6271)